MKTTILIISLLLLTACGSQENTSTDIKVNTMTPTSEIQITPNSSQDDQ